MVSWKSILKGDPTERLLEKDNPSVWYLTLTNILGRSSDDPEKLYDAKYKGTMWQLIILVELLDDGEDERIRL